MKVEYKVLVVDDDRDTLELVGDEIEELGISVNVLHVESFPQIGLLTDGGFDAFLIDIMLMLPEGDGFDLVDLIREQLGDSVAIVLMSQASKNPGYVSRARELDLPLYAKADLLKERGAKSVLRDFLGARPIRALVCDDTPDKADMMKETMLELGYEADVAYGVDIAKKMLSRRNFHIALIDVYWEGVDGQQPDGLEILNHLNRECSLVLTIAFSKYPAAFEGGVGMALSSGSHFTIRDGVAFHEKLSSILATACPFLRSSYGED